MDTGLTLIEFVGIPYVGKTQTLAALSRLLESRGISYRAIPEFRGSEEFYSRMKLTPEVNFFRSLNFIQHFSEAASDPRVRYVLVDRGLYDTHCWFEWFRSKNELPTHMAPVLASLFDALPYYAKKRRVVWMHRAPEEAVRAHGDKQGRIVNAINLTQLQAIYRDEIGTFENLMSFHPIDSSLTTAPQVAESLMRQLKIA